MSQADERIDEDRRWVIERFREAWAAPDVERFVALLHPDVRLLQPVTPPVVGRENARKEFSRASRGGRHEAPGSV